ncbi:hypothetical protein T265_11065 [Opisthorchis viverrini]|uniref:Uncharacterized protein n=1 Tax=Opisthorchis viverrini TaxID=6198 RepID=A0A074ZYV4_OPIVI|nr:hypothetical protein T265_11065 [Opisthorchis viverrini]KER20369.1 hypothetical protein T265_11065 [Opisthorchis viverrini]
MNNIPVDLHSSGLCVRIGKCPQRSSLCPVALSRWANQSAARCETELKISRTRPNEALSTRPNRCAIRVALKCMAPSEAVGSTHSRHLVSFLSTSSGMFPSGSLPENLLMELPGVIYRPTIKLPDPLSCGGEILGLKPLNIFKAGRYVEFCGSCSGNKN